MRPTPEGSTTGLLLSRAGRNYAALRRCRGQVKYARRIREAQDQLQTRPAPQRLG
jgi:hypothetical protein